MQVGIDTKIPEELGRCDPGGGSVTGDRCHDRDNRAGWRLPQGEGCMCGGGRATVQSIATSPQEELTARSE